MIGMQMRAHDHIDVVALQSDTGERVNDIVVRAA